ncbi:MAG: TolC family protein [Schleiferiaceae bacterium]
MNKCFTLLGLVLSATLGAQNLVTLDEALTSALEHNHDLYIADVSAQQAANSATYGNAGMLPSVTASAGANGSNQNSNLEFATGQTQDVAGAQSLSQNASLGVSQVLFAGGRIQRSYGLLKKSQQAADLSYRQALENTVAGVWSQYMAIALLQESVAVSTKSVAISQERYDKAVLTNDLGGSNSTDLLAAEVDLNRDKVSLLDLQTQLEAARNTFATFAGLSSRSFTVAQNTTLDQDAIGASVEEILTAVMNQNATVRLAEISAETAVLQQKLQQSTLFPSVSAQASYGLNQSQAEAGFLSSQQVTGFSAGVSLQYNLFSGFQSATQRQNAALESMKATRRLDQVRETMENTVRNAYRTFQNAQQVATLEAANATVAFQRFEKLQERYALGQASSLELRQSQLAWMAAEQGKMSAQFRATNAQIALLQLMGSIHSDQP